MQKKIKVKNIRPNPFRNIERYPIREEKVEALIKSFQQTGVWPVILGREVGDHVEIPFGHHRKRAWERILKPSDEIEVNIMKLSDTEMLQMMAHENMEEWGTTAIVEIETVAAVVKAYAEGKIELNGVPEKVSKASIRYAPSFIAQAWSTRGVDHPYVAQSIANFLGWTKTKGEPQQKVYTALSALELIEQEVLTEDDFFQLSSKQAEGLVSEAKARKEEREQEAREQERKAAEAKKRGETASSYQQRKLAEEQEKYAYERARKLRDRGKEEARQVGKHLSSGMREGRIATKNVSTEANKIVGLPKQEKELRGINTAARQVITGLDDILSADSYNEKLKKLLVDAAYIDPGVKEMLVGSLEALADRALDFAHKFGPQTIKESKEPTQKLLSNLCAALQNSQKPQLIYRWLL